MLVGIWLAYITTHMALKTLFLTSSVISCTVNICRYKHTTCKHAGVLSWFYDILLSSVGIQAFAPTYIPTPTSALWLKWWELSSPRTRDWLHISPSSLRWFCGWQICPHNSRRCPGTSRDITHFKLREWQTSSLLPCRP